MVLAYFLLAHLLADFIFQPTRLVKWKMKSVWGTLTHVFIHLVVNTLILLPFIIKGYTELFYLILGICLVHFFIDEIKINYDLKHDKKVRPFVVDQLLHLFTVLVANLFIKDSLFIIPDNLFYRIYTNISLLIFLSFIVVVSTVIEIYHFQKIREKNKSAKLKLSSKHMLTRVVVFTLIYAFFMFVTFVIAE